MGWPGQFYAGQYCTKMKREVLNAKKSWEKASSRAGGQATERELRDSNGRGRQPNRNRQRSTWADDGCLSTFLATYEKFIDKKKKNLRELAGG